MGSRDRSKLGIGTLLCCLIDVLTWNLIRPSASVHANLDNVRIPSASRLLIGALAGNSLRRLELETAWISREVAPPRPLSNAARASRFKQELERKPSHLTLECA